MGAIKALVVSLAFLAAGCGGKVVSEKYLVERNGLKYEANSGKLFTGKAAVYNDFGGTDAEGKYRDGKTVGKWIYRGDGKERIENY